MSLDLSLWGLSMEILPDSYSPTLMHIVLDRSHMDLSRVDRVDIVSYDQAMKGLSMRHSSVHHTSTLSQVSQRFHELDGMIKIDSFSPMHEGIQ